MSAISTTLPVRPIGPLGFAKPPNIEISCDAFSGTLETLVRCVINQKIDLWDIPLFPICQAYLDYVIGAKEVDFEGATSAMVAMAYLIERKSHRLIPLPETEPEEFDPEREFNTSITDFRGVIEALSGLEDDRNELFFRTTPGQADYELPLELGKVSVEDLGRALEQLLSKAVEQPNLFLSAPRRSLAEQMALVLRCLKPEPLPLVDLVEGVFNRVEAVWWFLALLELIRTREAVVIKTEEGNLQFYRNPELSMETFQ